MEQLGVLCEEEGFFDTNGHRELKKGSREGS
jgi:hypothetical protein